MIRTNSRINYNAAGMTNSSFCDVSTILHSVCSVQMAMLVQSKKEKEIGGSGIVCSFTWRERLLQLVGLLSIGHTKCVQVLGAADFELDNIFALLDFYRACIFPSGSEKEVLDLMNLLRLCITT